MPGLIHKHMATSTNDHVGSKPSYNHIHVKSTSKEAEKQKVLILTLRDVSNYNKCNVSILGKFELAFAISKSIRMIFWVLSAIRS